MAGNTTSTNMGLLLPTVYSDDGAWGGDLNTTLSTVDTHDHSPGKGVKVPSAGLNINADLSFGNFKLQSVSRIDVTDIITLQTGNNLIYVKGGNLFYNDGGGNQIALTSGGAVAGAAGNITGLTGSNTVVFTPANGTISFNYLGVSAAMILQASEYQAGLQYSFGVGTPPGTNFLNFSSSIFNFNLVNKVFGIALSGATASTKTTLAVSQTVNRTLTLPDATDTLVGKATADILTNKTVNVANNTFTFRNPTLQKFLSTGTTTGWLFTISTSTTCAVGDTYTNNSNTYTVLGALSAQTGQVLFMSGASAPLASGTLTRSAGAGTASVTFTSNVALATYTTPANALYLKVTMVGGGGGGAGGGTAAGTPAGAGGNTTFGTTLLVANGGGGGVWSGLSSGGGTASLGTGPLGIAITGSTAQGSSTSTNASGTPGVSTALGGGGAGGGAGVGAGTAAVANTGSGGGGGGGATSGPGGSCAGFVSALITAPLATYVYTVGAAGTAGGAGTSGNAGGAGASGVVVVEEFYQ